MITTPAEVVTAPGGPRRRPAAEALGLRVYRDSGERVQDGRHEIRAVATWRIRLSMGLSKVIYVRCGAGVTDFVHHGDRGTQYVSMHYTNVKAHRAGAAPGDS